MFTANEVPSSPLTLVSHFTLVFASACKCAHSVIRPTLLNGHQLFGETEHTYPQPGLDTTIRVTDLAQQIVKNLPSTDPNYRVIYNQEWRNATHYPIEAEDWFSPINATINGRQDAFSQR